MKKVMAAVFVISSLICSGPFAKSETNLYTYPELYSQAQTDWVETYYAYDREIQINVRFKMPEVYKLPVLKVQRQKPISDSVLKDFQKQFTCEKITNNPGQLSIVCNDVHKEILEMKSDYSILTIDFDLDELKQSNNAVPEVNLSQVEEILNFFEYQKNFLLQQNSVSLSAPVQASYNRYVDCDGRPLSESGFYAFAFNQLIYDIPVLSNIRAHYRNPIKSENGIYLMANRFYCKNSESFNLNLNLLEELECAMEDMPVCSIEKIKSTCEQLIDKGLVRGIQSIELGYVLYDDQEDGSFFWAVPTWLVRCEYFDSPEKEWGEKAPETRTTSTLAINSQDGTFYDLLSEEASRSVCPTIIPF